MQEIISFEDFFLESSLYITEKDVTDELLDQETHSSEIDLSLPAYRIFSLNKSLPDALGPVPTYAVKDNKVVRLGLLYQAVDEGYIKQGYTEKYPPFMVRSATLYGAGQLPKFRDNLYKDYEEDLWMVPTAEVPLTGLHMEEILLEADLPRYYTAYTPCFRREKMSAGRDVRGIKRGHQFDKVEMYIFCRPEDSATQLERMLNIARLAGDKEIISVLSPKKSLASYKRELIQSIRHNKVEQELWNGYVEAVNSQQLLANAITEGKLSEV